jgi:hypothetical protein
MGRQQCTLPYARSTEVLFINNRRMRAVMSNTVVEHYTIHMCFSAPKLGGRAQGTLFSGRMGSVPNLCYCTPHATVGPIGRIVARPVVSNSSAPPDTCTCTCTVVQLINAPPFCCRHEKVRMADWFKRRIAGRKRLRPAPSQAAGDHAPVISTTTSTGLSQPAGVQIQLKALSPPTLQLQNQRKKYRAIQT